MLVDILSDHRALVEAEWIEELNSSTRKLEVSTFVSSSKHSRQISRCLMKVNTRTVCSYRYTEASVDHEDGWSKSGVTTGINHIPVRVHTMKSLAIMI